MGRGDTNYIQYITYISWIWYIAFSNWYTSSAHKPRNSAVISWAKLDHIACRCTAISAFLRNFLLSSAILACLRPKTQLGYLKAKWHHQHKNMKEKQIKQKIKIIFLPILISVSKENVEQNSKDIHRQSNINTFLGLQRTSDSKSNYTRSTTIFCKYLEWQFCTLQHIC